MYSYFVDRLNIVTDRTRNGQDHRLDTKRVADLSARY